MAVLCKCSPVDITQAGPDLLRIRTKFDAADRPAVGGAIFVWSAEARGGHGLVARGRILAMTVEASGQVIEIAVLDTHPLLHIGKELLGRVEEKHPHLRLSPDEHDGSALFTLWKKLYYFSPNRTVPLMANERSLLEAAFTSTS